MRAQNSIYLNTIKPYLKQLIDILYEDFQYVSILATDCKGKKYVVSQNSNSIEPNMLNERGFVVRVYNGKNYSEYSFNEINKENILELAQNIKREIKKNHNKFEKNFNIKEYELIKEITDTRTFEKGVKIHPILIKESDILESLNTSRRKGIELSSLIKELKLVYEYLNVNKLFLTSQTEFFQSYLYSIGMRLCVVEQDGKVKYDYESFSGLKGTELLEELDKDMGSFINNTIDLLESMPMVPGYYDVICSPKVSGLIAHEAFGHGVEMDMFVKERAKAKDEIDNCVASDLVNMYDGALGMEHVASYSFDDEGNLANNTKVIDKGILKEGISDQISAMELRTKPTGNGRRESFKRKAYSRMSNTYFCPGDSELDEMIKSIEYGFLLEGVQSGMEDPKNWGIQCIVTKGKEIKNGKLTGRIYSPIIITGYVPEVLKSITMISKDLVMDGAGICGKGYKEYVKVSSGGPYIKAKVRLG